MDEFERGLRKLLNLGHTVGHAIEKLSGYKIPHGQSVAMGIGVITRAAVRLGMCPHSDCARIISALSACGLPTETFYGASELAGASLADKKRSGALSRLSCPALSETARLLDIPVSDLQGIIERAFAQWRSSMTAKILPAPLCGKISAVTSKSDAHRLLICAALADRPTK